MHVDQPYCCLVKEETLNRVTFEVGVVEDGDPVIAILGHPYLIAERPVVTITVIWTRGTLEADVVDEVEAVELDCDTARLSGGGADQLEEEVRHT